MENKNEIMLFKNEEFGEVRTLVIDGEPWFVRKDSGFKRGVRTLEQLCAAPVRTNCHAYFLCHKVCYF